MENNEETQINGTAQASQINRTTQTQAQTTNQEESALLKAYKELQQNSVSKEQYNKEINELKEKNAIYLKAITEGEKIDTPSEDSDNIQDVIADISKFKGTNLEYWQKMNKAIDMTLKTLPEDEIVNAIGSEGLDELIKVNEGMRKIVEDSNGNPDMFRILCKDRIQDSAPKISAEIEKFGGLYGYWNNIQQKNNK